VALSVSALESGLKARSLIAAVLGVRC
jgi:hypothetical protein